MRGGKFEQDLSDMEAKPTAEMALRYKGLIVGVKTAHYNGPEWAPVERAVEAGTIANIPVMVDFGTNRPERPMSELVTKRLGRATSTPMSIPGCATSRTHLEP
jgi:dihydroorotase